MENLHKTQPNVESKPVLRHKSISNIGGNVCKCCRMLMPAWCGDWWCWHSVTCHCL